jgi:hypothetical protein
MLFTFRRKEAPWEVVDNRSIEPVRMFTDKDGASARSSHIWPMLNDAL